MAVCTVYTNIVFCVVYDTKNYICVAYIKQVKKMNQEQMKHIIDENQEFIQNSERITKRLAIPIYW